MAFDIEGARKSGYSDGEIADYLGSEKGFDVAGARKAGYGDADIVKHLTMLPQASAAKAKPSTSADAIGSVVNTISEPLVAMATGVAGQVAGGLAGIGGAIMPGPPGQGADVAQRVSQAMTYEPRSAGGKAVMGGIAKPFEWLAGKARDAGNYTLNKTNSPALATAVDTGINMLPMAAGGVAGRFARGEAPEAAAARAAQKSMNSVKDETWALASQEGFVAPPSAIRGGSFVGNRVESIGGKAAMSQDAQLRNQQVANKVARREAGLAEDSPISEKTLEVARDTIAAPYREFEKLPGLPAERYATQLNPMRRPYGLIGDTPPEPTQLVHDWKSANSKATELWRDYQRNAKVETLDAYKSALKEREGIEGLMDKTAQAAGRPDLIQAMKDARVKFAKNYNVERALNVGSGDVDPRVFGTMLDKGIPLSGGLETIGRFANAFRPYVRDAAMVPTPGVSKIAPVVSAGLGIGGHAAFGPAGLLAAGLPLLDTPARSLMFSKAMQGGRTYDRSALSFAREEAMRKAGLLGLMGQSSD